MSLCCRLPQPSRPPNSKEARLVEAQVKPVIPIPRVCAVSGEQADRIGGAGKQEKYPKSFFLVILGQKCNPTETWRFVPIIPGFGRLRQDCLKFKASRKKQNQTTPPPPPPPPNQSSRLPVIRPGASSLCVPTPGHCWTVIKGASLGQGLPAQKSPEELPKHQCLSFRPDSD